MAVSVTLIDLIEPHTVISYLMQLFEVSQLTPTKSYTTLVFVYTVLLRISVGSKDIRCNVDWIMMPHNDETWRIVLEYNVPLKVYVRNVNSNFSDGP